MTELDKQILEKRKQEKIAFVYRDIMERYHVGETKARGIIRSIRKACGGGMLGAGKVLLSEVEWWESHPSTVEVARL